MMIRRTKLFRFTAISSVILLIHLIVLPQASVATTTFGYHGHSVPGRISWIVVNCASGVKVNTFLGSMSYARRDLYIRSRGLPLEVTLTYNGDRAGSDAGFGNGWFFSYHVSALRKSDDSVVIDWGDGRHDLFAFSGGAYSPANEGVTARLEQVPGPKLRLTSKEHLQYTFDLPAQMASSEVSSIQDSDGNTLSMVYDLSHRLVSVTDAVGRPLQFHYTGNHVDTVTDPSLSPARVLHYAYDASGDLIQATDAAGVQTKYLYDSSHRMRVITDPIGRTIVNYAGPNGSTSSVNRYSNANVLLESRSFIYDTGSRTTSVTDRVDPSTRPGARARALSAV